MSCTAIKIEGLGKRYRIGQEKASNAMLREAIMKAITLNHVRKMARDRREKEYIWALRDATFEVRQGDVVGIIGHNGAGKSTLLKLLSRITEPTEGRADIYGRVGSLLEVGTGFHLELTGRENVYLSGAIMGMKKSDIRQRFDEIVAFADVHKFIDTPLKHYSSGMFLRLAFSVAAHLEPEILLVDEVLAVGDLEFQRKCLNKMESVATAGRTVLFVSHNLGSIKELCSRSVVLKNGRIDYQGDVLSGIQHYSRSVLDINTEKSSGLNGRGWVKININDGNTSISNTEPFDISATLALSSELSHVGIHCFIEDSEGTQIVHNRELGFRTLAEGRHRVTARIPPLYLKPGAYTLYLKLVGEARNSVLLRYFSERLLLDVTDKTGIFNGKVRAAVLPPVAWSVNQVDAGERIPA